MDYHYMKNIKQKRNVVTENQTEVDEIIRQSRKKNGVVLIEDLVKMDHVDQYADKVVNYTSRFNRSNSLSYAPTNITGRYVIYPSYGDFPDAYFLRSYGKWWVNRDAYQKEYMPQDLDPLLAEDHITLEFEIAVVPRDICIYEVYNPGAVVRIWGRSISGQQQWVLLWEGEPEVCPDVSRKFHPKIKLINNMINTIRLEFNQSKLRYHTSIDAVVLGGFVPRSELVSDVIRCQLSALCESIDEGDTKEVSESFTVETNGEEYFSNLPYEVIIHIFQYLDMKSLCRCAQVNKRWCEIVNDPVLYQNLSLKRYWHIVSGNTLNHFLDKCKGLKKLDLSWCGNEDPKFPLTFKMVLNQVSKSLTHLSLGNCEYVSNDIINSISECAELVDLRLKNTPYWRISTLDCLKKLVSLDLTSTLIQDNDLIKILRENPNLKHLIIDLCEDLRRLDHVVVAATQYNKKLETWSSWKTPSLTYEGARNFGLCENLKDLDLGWCLLSTHPVDSLQKIAEGCKKLRRLILSEWRGINDQLILPIIMNCKDLHQLDLLGIRGLSAEICERALVNLPKLRLLDISFCVGVDQSQVAIWREQYPHITIQRSCQYVVNDFWIN